MPISDFDRELEKLSAPEVREQRLKREAAERKRRASGPPDLDPTPLAERELVADDGYTRVYRQVDLEAGIRHTLEEAHRAWVRVGSPEEGPMAEELVQRLADAYLVAPAESEIEAEVVSYAEYLGLTDMLGPLADSYNANLRREEYAEIAADAFRGLPPEAVAKAGQLLEPELLRQVKEGIADPDELRAALTLRAEAAVETVSAERRRANLADFDEELARHTVGEELQAQYREELAASSEEQVQVSPKRIAARAEQRLGIAPEKDPLEGFDEAATEIGAYVTEEQLQREEQFAKAVEESEAEARG